MWVKGTITLTNPNNNIAFNRQLTLKDNAPFISCVSKINGETVENAEDLNIVMPMYNLLEYSENYEKTSGSLFNYHRDEPSESGTGDGNNRISISIENSKSFDYKTKIVGSSAAGAEQKDVTIAVPLKYLGNFWRNLDIPLINCKITLILSCYKECVLVGRVHRNARDAEGEVAAIPRVESPTNAIFEVTD